MTWQGENFGAALKAIAQAVEPDRPALIHGERVISWSDFDRITDSIAAGLLARGLKPFDVAGQMQRNSPEYLLAYFGCAKAGVTPVNVNYRYMQRELKDIFGRFGIKALFVDDEFASISADAMPDGSLALIITDPENDDWRRLCAEAVDAAFEPCNDPGAMFLMATGGTTGMPKAVMWPFGEFWQANRISTWSVDPTVEPFVATSFEEHVAMAAKVTPDHPDAQAPLMLLCPLMHGTAQYSAVAHLLRGGTIVSLPGVKFDAHGAIETIRDRKVKAVVIVGDAHAIPIAEALEARNDASEAFSSLRLIGSSGAIFSTALKERLIAANPAMVITDVLGSSEAGGATAVRITTKEGTSGGGDFMAAPDVGVTLFDEDLVEIEPGSDKVGIVARTGPLPLGYLGEDTKNAETFPTINGKRYLMTGDRARWGEEGAIEFIGRDNMCINTGGEKVFPEEVEEVLMGYAKIHDARVVSLPDERFGRKIVAVIQPGEGESVLQDEIDAHVRANLAGYKVPRLYLFTQEGLRLNNGKPDYKAAQKIADEAVA